MAVRQLFQSHPAAVAGGAALLLAVAAVAIAVQSRRPDSNNLGYFLDLQTGELFTADVRQIPPVDAPSGAGNGVSAAVYACGQCDDPAQRFTAYIQKFEPGKTEKDDPIGFIAPVPDAGKPTWVAMDQPGAGELVNSPSSRCGEQPAVPCKP